MDFEGLKLYESLIFTDNSNQNVSNQKKFHFN
jgi:hypothetical protein